MINIIILHLMIYNKDARFIKALNEKFINTLALFNKIYRNGVIVRDKFIGPKPVTMEMYNLT